MVQIENVLGEALLMLPLFRPYGTVQMGNDYATNISSLRDGPIGTTYRQKKSIMSCKDGISVKKSKLNLSHRDSIPVEKRNKQSCPVGTAYR